MTHVLDVVATTGGKATLETIRQTPGAKGRGDEGSPRASRPPRSKRPATRKRKAAAAKASATKGPQGRHDAAVKAARTRKLKGRYVKSIVDLMLT